LFTRKTIITQRLGVAGIAPTDGGARQLGRYVRIQGIFAVAGPQQTHDMMTALKKCTRSSSADRACCAQQEHPL
jgi:hypothetical protein